MVTTPTIQNTNEIYNIKSYTRQNELQRGSPILHATQGNQLRPHSQTQHRRLKKSKVTRWQPEDTPHWLIIGNTPTNSPNYPPTLMVLNTYISRLRVSLLRDHTNKLQHRENYCLKVNNWQARHTYNVRHANKAQPPKPAFYMQHKSSRLISGPYPYFTAQRFKTSTVTLRNKDTLPSHSQTNTQKFITKKTLGNYRRRLHHDTPTKQPPKCTCTRGTTRTQQHRKLKVATIALATDTAKHS